MKFYMNEIQTPIYLDSNFVWNSEAFSLSHYKERSIFQSNCVEFWAPITDIVIPGVPKGVYWVSSWGNTWNYRRQAPIGLSLHKKGYWQFQMYIGNGKAITRKLHVLIMKTFCYFPGCDNYSINHIDCNKQNNNLYNLEWCTESENTIHAIQNNVKTVFGKPANKVILTDEQVEKIYDLYTSGVTDYRQIMRILEIDPYEVSISLVRNICHKRSRIAWFKKNGLL